MKSPFSYGIAIPTLHHLSIEFAKTSGRSSFLSELMACPGAWKIPWWTMELGQWLVYNWANYGLWWILNYSYWVN